MNVHKPSDQSNGSIIQVVKWLAMSLSCLAIFSLGVFLGKQFSDSDRSFTETASENPSSKARAVKMIPRENASNTNDMDMASQLAIPTQESTKKGDNSSDLTAPAVEQQAQPQQSIPTTTQNLAPPTVEPQSQDIPSQGDEVEKQKQVHLAEPVVKEVETQIQDQQVKSESSSDLISQLTSHPSLPQKVAESMFAKYTIQISLHREEDKAQSDVTYLKNQGLNAFYMSFTEGDQTWHRVSSGVYAERSLAESERNRILKTTSIQEASVQEILKGSF